MKQSFVRTAALVTAALCSSVYASAETRGVLTGNTSVSLDAGFLSALTTLGVTPSINRPAILNGTVASFPVTSGELDLSTAKGEILHVGGLTLTAGGTSVNLVNFIIDTSGTSPVLTGAVIVNGSLVGRIPLFDLALPSLTLPLTPLRNVAVAISPVGVTLSAQAAAALNGAFGITALGQGLAIGEAFVGIGIGPGGN